MPEGKNKVLTVTLTQFLELCLEYKLGITVEENDDSGVLRNITAASYLQKDISTNLTVTLRIFGKSQLTPITAVTPQDLQIGATGRALGQAREMKARWTRQAAMSSF